MRTTTYLLALAAALLATLAVAEDAAAQSCFFCDDTSWTQRHCGDADWTMSGRTSCEIVYLPGLGEFCHLDGDHCWGPDPEEEQLPALALALTGTWLTPNIGLGRGATTAIASRASVYMRTCKDIITARFYGDEARAEIEANLSVIEI